MTDMDFQALRDQWALKAPLPSKDVVQSQADMDRHANPHNDSYRRPRRSEAEIISDLAYQFADAALKQQYGWHYTNWLKSQKYEEKCGFFKAGTFTELDKSE